MVSTSPLFLKQKEIHRAKQGPYGSKNKARDEKETKQAGPFCGDRTSLKLKSTDNEHNHTVEKQKRFQLNEQHLQKRIFNCSYTDITDKQDGNDQCTKLKVKDQAL